MKTKILILASNPKGTGFLELPTEIRNLMEAIKRSPERDRFMIETRLAVRPKDLQAALLEVQPRIVHFCGHGEGEKGLILENDAGQLHLVSSEALANLFSYFSDRIECVLLNACHTKMQAEEIVKHINFVIGMNQPILDRSAIIFSEAFYGALGSGESIARAYQFGCNRIHLECSETLSQQRKLVPIDPETDNQNQSIPEHLIPILFTNKNLKKINQMETLSESELTGIPSNTSTSSKRRRLEQQLEDLQPPYNLLRKKLSRLRGKRSIENDPSTEFKLDEQIKEAQEEIEKIETTIEKIEEKLN